MDEVESFFCDLYKFAQNKNNIRIGFDDSGNKYNVYYSDVHLETYQSGLDHISNKLLSINKENQLPYAKLIISSICWQLLTIERDFCISENDFYRPGKNRSYNYIMVETDDTILCIGEVEDNAFYTLKDFGQIECSYVKGEAVEFVQQIGDIFKAFLINIYDVAKSLEHIVLDKYDERNEGNESSENNESEKKYEDVILKFSNIISTEYSEYIKELKDIMKMQGFLSDDYKWNMHNGYPTNMLGKIHRYLKDKGVILSIPSIAATVTPFCLEFGITLNSKKKSQNDISRRTMECR